jgi:ribose transport system permease protein
MLASEKHQVAATPTVATPNQAISPGTARTNHFAFRSHLQTFAARFGVLSAFLLTVVIMSLLRPTTFATMTNARTMLTEMAPLTIASVGATVVLVMGDFDLSIGAMITLSGTTTVYLMFVSGLPPWFAILSGAGAGLLVGLVNGVLIAGAGTSSFIVTLAMGTVLTGIEGRLSNQQSIFGPTPQSFSFVANGSFLGASMQIWIAAAVVLVLWLTLEKSVIGRSMYAIGGNGEAARLSGIRVSVVRTVGFLTVATCAALAGILIAAQSGSSTPGVGLPLLLPIYAASFLGSTVLVPGRFSILGTVVGSMFLQVIATGLILLDLATPVVSVVQGSILIVAVLVARAGSNNA